MSFTPNGVRSNQWRWPEVPASAVGRCNTRKLPLISPFLNLAVRQTHHYVRISTTPETPSKPLKKSATTQAQKVYGFLRTSILIHKRRVIITAVISLLIILDGLQAERVSISPRRYCDPWLKPGSSAFRTSL